jgi:hypothetical protein
MRAGGIETHKSDENVFKKASRKRVGSVELANNRFFTESRRRRRRMDDRTCASSLVQVQVEAGKTLEESGPKRVTRSTTSAAHVHQSAGEGNGVNAFLKTRQTSQI